MALKKQRGIVMEDELWKAVATAAKAADLSRGALIRRAIRAYLDAGGR